MPPAFAALVGLVMASDARATLNYGVCPNVGNDVNGCQLLITVTAQSGGVAIAYTVTQNPVNDGPFDGAEDTLIGITNLSGSTLTSIVLTGAPGSDIAGFDGDGACSGGYSPEPTAAQCGGAYTTTNPQDYASAGVTFTNFSTVSGSGTHDTVTVNFSLTNGSSAFFSLENALTPASISPPLVAPTITKAFSPSTVFQSQTSTLTFTIANSNALALTGLAFTDTFPSGLLGVSINSNTCGGTAALVAGPPSSLSLSGGTVAASSSCTVIATVQAEAGGSLVNTTSTLTSNAPMAAAATATLVVFPSADSGFQERYSANLNLGESYIDITNDGANGASLLGPGLGGAVGNICVNVYAFDPSEELVSCCSCLVTPDQTVNLGVIADLTSKTLTGVIPTSVTVKLLATLAGTNGSGTGTVCNNSAASVTATTTGIAGLAAWGTTLHAQGTGTATTETPFTPSTLSSGELASIAGRCGAIIGNASGFGICTSCRTGGLGGQKL
jgi:hypothetical protein